MRATYFLFSVILLLTACTKSQTGGYNLPLLYKIDVQQGNVVEQEMLNKLEQGMDQDKVKFILGTPILIDPFHTNRWEYVYSYSKNGEVREQRHITVYFDENKLLSHIRGDVVAGTGIPVLEEIESPSKEVVVPEGAIQKKEKGFFGRMLDKVLPEE